MTEEISENQSRSALSAGAQVISWVFSPLLMPVYGVWIALWGSPLAWLPERTRWYAVLYTFVLTCLIPMVFIGCLRLFKVVKSLSLRDRRDRGIPYLVALLCYGVCMLHFKDAHAPEWFYLFFAGAGVSIAIVAGVNMWWKMSAHATGAGGLVALTFQLTMINLRIFDLTYVLIGVILIAGLTGTSRLLLGRHTPAQVWAGYVNGFVCVLSTALLY